MAEHEGKVRWHESFDSLPSGFLLLAANELFDAIPIRQFVRTAQGFRERMVGLDAEGRLTFAAGIAGVDPALLPSPAPAVAEGTIFEISPARDAVMAALCERLRAGGGTAIIIDYGHLATGYGDTLQAVRNHEYDPPLANPGLADLTSHVDFEQLASRAKAEGVQINGLARQGDSWSASASWNAPRPSAGTRTRRLRKASATMPSGLRAPARERWESCSRCWW